MHTLFNILNYNIYRIYVYFWKKRSGNRRTHYLAINIRNQNNARVTLKSMREGPYKKA